jgi:hypothetical protein
VFAQGVDWGCLRKGGGNQNCERGEGRSIVGYVVVFIVSIVAVYWNCV